MNKMGESKIMKKYKGVVFFDYDGTTVDEVDEIATATPKTAESLNKLKENYYEEYVKLEKIFKSRVENYELLSGEHYER